MAEKSTSTPPSKLQATSARLQTSIRREPLAAFRVFFFVLIWTLALANVVIVVQEFQDSLPFIIGVGGRRRIGIEDSRRQALPVIIAPSVTLIILIPIAVGLPLFGIAGFLSRYIIEALWTGLIVVLTLAGAASLSPQPTSPLLPRTLQYNLSLVLALSFFIVIFLSFYNIILLCRISFLLGKGIPNPLHAPVPSLLLGMKTQEDLAGDEQSEKVVEDHTQQATPSEIARVDQRLENGSIKTLSSGWDDEDDGKPSKAPKNESGFAKARAIFSSPLKSSPSKS
ncbi:uncharacterized protein PGTG_00954 [Puccinia graminis f. sp. tritici CRL 75-36-700-3]|uniref:Uncharacterized protein n=1 Tax=Puccinia graminis f. sp. tritici (strain CRL 75-36-700-3 / race SCCL) TaxID=418459 RepID=E3JU98_PUCGT|nr:uncharacterized protein PGTG_00954 [Puccinia graminis f. sp. tritici CRL 75-36-700-3]EFP75623.2 hypothetical protein PGTG_00954 [Puccinia graminis f. sp. tritici CRL 75-36-700-3]